MSPIAKPSPFGQGDEEQPGEAGGHGYPPGHISGGLAVGSHVLAPGGGGHDGGGGAGPGGGWS